MEEEKNTSKEIDDMIQKVRDHLEEGAWTRATTLLFEIHEKLQDTGGYSDAALTEMLSKLLEDINEFLLYTQPSEDEARTGHSRRSLLTEKQKCAKYVINKREEIKNHRH